MSASREEQNSSKMKDQYDKIVAQNPRQNARLMFQDEAGFGRINKPEALLVQESRATVRAMSPHS